MSTGNTVPPDQGLEGKKESMKAHHGPRICCTGRGRPKGGCLGTCCVVRGGPMGGFLGPDELVRGQTHRRVSWDLMHSGGVGQEAHRRVSWDLTRWGREGPRDPLAAGSGGFVRTLRNV